MGEFRAIVLQTSENDKHLLWKNLICLDYPDIESTGFTLDCFYGNFGEARKEVADATGITDYNFMAKSVFVNSKGIINEEGTKITLWGMANKLEEWVWLDEEMIKELKDDRDPYDAPRYYSLLYY